MTTAEQQQQHIIYSDDGSMYTGNMKDGKKHGCGTLRTPVLIYGIVTTNGYKNNSHLANWNECSGNWEDDQLLDDGCGVYTKNRGDGTRYFI